MKHTQKNWHISYQHIGFNIGLLLAGVFFAHSLYVGHQPASTAVPPVHITSQPRSAHSQPGSVAAPVTVATSGQARVAPAKPSHYATDSKQAGQVATASGQRYPLITYHATALPNDPLASQWWVTSNNMSAVWGMTAGGRATKIAIIDTGFALQHEDLADRWAHNSGEMGPTTQEAATAPNCTSRGLPLDKSCNGLDDDGNGFVDDYMGWDFSNNDNRPQAGETNPDGAGTTHGTTTAGVMAADYNNAKGIAGVNRYSTILPLQALDDDGTGDTYSVGQAVYYAADQGADVISVSLGASSPDAYLRQAIQYAMGKGAIVVAAAGNDGCDCLSYPANYPEVLAVGASTPTGDRASFSSYGANLDLLAPGQSITSTYWTKLNGTSAYANSLAGTSYSVPFVSGLLGLARSYQPTANWDEVIGAMLENADRHGLNVTTPRTTMVGFGYTKADSMLQRLVTPQTSTQKTVFDQRFIGSARAYQCPSGVIPATAVYSLTTGSSLSYTVSPLEQAKQVAAGASSSTALYACIGLPGDTASSVKSLSLASELGNNAGAR